LHNIAVDADMAAHFISDQGTAYPFNTPEFIPDY